jgi:preprotein translocase subunit YajC
MLLLLLLMMMMMMMMMIMPTQRPSQEQVPEQKLEPVKKSRCTNRNAL